MFKLVAVWLAVGFIVAGYYFFEDPTRFMLGGCITMLIMLVVIMMHAFFSKIFHAPPVSDEMADRIFVLDTIALLVVTATALVLMPRPFDTNASYWLAALLALLLAGAFAAGALALGSYFETDYDRAMDY